MPMTGVDPLQEFLSSLAGERKPIPLVATRIDVLIKGGLAIVTTERTFRNIEKQSIEATMTFPVPVDATLVALRARIEGRTLNAIAQARAEARETYEGAIEKGKTAVLHEELLKGIHMLSVGHVRPGAEIVVTDTWTAPLSFMDATPRLRIPTTVGEIYGRTPLRSSDDLVTGGELQHASIAIVSENGTASLLRAGEPKDGRYDVTLDAPIDIAVSGWTVAGLEGVAADGRKVTLDIAPAAKAHAGLDLDLLFDHSGSMAERAAGSLDASASKFQVAREGLLAVARDRLKATDRIRLWEFNDRVDFVGEGTGPATEHVVRKIGSPDGGTEITRAFNAVIASGAAKDIVIVTDGKSWAFEPQLIARAGVRVTAVLIGEDALEAGIGHLAGMTGGQLLVSTGGDADTAIAAALEAARAPFAPSPPIEGNPVRVETFRRGARVTATWGVKATGEASVAARQIGATAVALAIPLMNKTDAATLAEAEGIVTHLTSLVLVDEAGERSAGLPASRKVALSSPRSALLSMASLGGFAAIAPASARPAAPRAAVERRFLSLDGPGVCDDDSEWGSRAPSPPPPRPASPAAPAAPQLSRFVNHIDWDGDPEALRRGDLAGVPTRCRAADPRRCAIAGGGRASEGARHRPDGRGDRPARARSRRIKPFRRAARQRDPRRGGGAGGDGRDAGVEVVAIL
jgi:hypothetical protein